MCATSTVSVMTSKIRRVLNNPLNPRSVSGRARAVRWEEFKQTFPHVEDMKVLDLGGTPSFWRSADTRPAHLTIVNIMQQPSEADWIDNVSADACLYEPTQTFDLVMSNSLLEHVGGHYRRVQLAEVIRGAAPHHWVQTPYRYFPVEPHWVAPGMQFLPPNMRALFVQHWPLGARTHHDDPRGALREALETDLVSAAEMRYLFPDSRLWKERFGGLTKSLVAVR